MSEKHIIKDIRIAPIETYFGAPGIGRIVGRNSKGEKLWGTISVEWAAASNDRQRVLTGVTKR